MKKLTNLAFFMNLRWKHTIFSILIVLFISGFLNSDEIEASKQISPDNSSQKSTPLQVGVSNDTCLSCHEQPDFYTGLPSGEQLYLTVDREVYDNSVHGLYNYACVQCHVDIREYPHPPNQAVTRRDVTLNLNASCARCHQSMYDKTLDSVHEKALEAGNKEAAVCSDCHGAHNTQPPDQPRSRIPKTCERCHSQIFNEYEESVHGEALIGEGNPDVPTCIDCHGVHNVEGPSTGPFLLFSPLICAKCHADENLMNKYGISTDVFETYVSDFHGTTVVIFEATAPGQETNKPVCVDCHGVHDMRKVDDPESRVIQGNLLGTCQRCHPDATTNFPTAWLGHYIPDRERFPIVYFIRLFYLIFIPATLGIMAIFVVSDIVRRFVIRNRQEQKNA